VVARVERRRVAVSARAGRRDALRHATDDDPLDRVARRERVGEEPDVARVGLADTAVAGDRLERGSADLPRADARVEDVDLWVVLAVVAEEDLARGGRVLEAIEEERGDLVAVDILDVAQVRAAGGGPEVAERRAILLDAVEE